ncbi:MAG: 3-deoxy-D-manno-octulosonic acid transferase [Luteibaculum sp.]
MSRWLYEIGIRCYGTALHGIAPFHKKARKWVDGRKGVFKHVKEVRDTFTLAPAHFHCASLGEYEQALPIIECYHQKHPKRPISISFFSPSGFEHAKLPDWVSLVFYLPLDLKKNARKLTDTLNPHFFAGIKYEVWPNIIGCFKAQGTPCFLLCGNFRTDHIYFKPRGQFLLETLKQFEAISVQNSSSKKLLAKYNIPANNFGKNVPPYKITWKNCQKKS